MRRWRGREREVGRRGGTTFLFSALPGDLKTPPNRPFRLFGAFGRSGRVRGGRRLLVAGFCRRRRRLLRARAAAELRGGEDAAAAAAAAILWGGLALRKRRLHPVVSAAALPARVRRRGLGVRGIRHRAGARSSEKLPPTRSTSVRVRGCGAAPPVTSPRPTRPLNPRGPHSRLRDASGTSPQLGALRAAPNPGGFPTGASQPTCSRRAREGAEPRRTRSTNREAAPASADAARPAGGGASRGGARQKGRVPRPARASTPAPRADRTDSGAWRGRL